MGGDVPELGVYEETQQGRSFCCLGSVSSLLSFCGIPKDWYLLNDLVTMFRPELLTEDIREFTSIVVAKDKRLQSTV